MKTITQIKDYCDNKCSDKNCKGKLLKRASKNHKFCGIITVKKGEYYCGK